jgi:hypothetical protein
MLQYYKDFQSYTSLILTIVGEKYKVELPHFQSYTSLILTISNPPIPIPFTNFQSYTSLILTTNDTNIAFSWNSSFNPTLVWF